MRIGTLAQATGLTRDTLRFYERQGLLKARRRANGYRDYPPEAVEWLGYLRTAQRLGFSLQEIAANLEEVERAADPDAYLQGLLRDKVAVIEARIEELQVLRQTLQARMGESCPLRG
ncbi:MerR family transcriptional regulator [Pseudomonas oryzihabitans]|uniref:MerR family transcriptional regulator n=1 Tax=Pseudomonas oryzihabitans TaxID=47885 RepID=UPI001123AD00|nr:MerR family transcriptional regulator [Pseudomonas psychrotolerans]QDD90480.1 MerR family transcriptional regulator [Pseudomonas psychrotolerans]